VGAEKTLLKLYDAYGRLYKLAEDKGDNVIAEEACEIQEDIKKEIMCMEGYARQIEDMGLAIWLGEQI
jgi:hypothetical protein